MSGAPVARIAAFSPTKKRSSPNAAESNAASDVPVKRAVHVIPSGETK